MIGEQKIERRRHHDLVAPGLAGNPTVFFQIVGSGSNDVRHRVDDIAAAVTVEIHCIFLECGRHELGRSECACPRPDQTIGPNISALENFQRGKEFLAEIILPAANAGERGRGTDHRTIARQRAVVGFDTPDGSDGIAIHAVGALHSVEDTPILFEQSAALLDALVGHQDVEIVPEGFGEFRLIVEKIHNPQIGRERSGISLEARFAKCRAAPLPATAARCSHGNLRPPRGSRRRSSADDRRSPIPRSTPAPVGLAAEERQWSAGPRLSRLSCAATTPQAAATMPASNENRPTLYACRSRLYPYP